MQNFQQYEWSSYKRHLLPQPSLLKKDWGLEWFNGRESYVEFHTSPTNLDNIADYEIDDD